MHRYSGPDTVAVFKLESVDPEVPVPVMVYMEGVNVAEGTEER